MSYAPFEAQEQPEQPRMVPPQPPIPWAVYTLIGLIVAVYLLSILLNVLLGQGGFFQPSLFVLLLLGAKENSLIDGGQYWRLITATFLHGNLIHIFFNSFALYALGPECERIYGLKRFLVLYFLAGLGGSVASYLMSPAPSVGASGAVFGLIGGLGMFFYLSRAALGEFGKAQVQSMAAIAGINLVIGFSAAGVIDNWGHMGGMVIGALVGTALAPRLSVDQRFFPPLMTRAYPPWGTTATVAVGGTLVLLALLLPGA